MNSNYKKFKEWSKSQKKDDYPKIDWALAGVYAASFVICWASARWIVGAFFTIRGILNYWRF